MMKCLIVFILLALPFVNAQQNKNADELFTTEVSNFHIGEQIFRIWASTRNESSAVTRKQFRYDPLFLPVFDSDGHLAISKIKVNDHWRVQLPILLDSQYAASEAFKVLQQTYPKENQLQRLNVFAKPIKSISLSLPELEAYHPRCKLLRRTINFHKPENEFLLIIECPSEEKATEVIKSLPNYRIVYDMSVNSFLSFKNRISVDMNVLQNSKLFAELDGVAKNGIAYIHRQDMRNLLDDIHEKLNIDVIIEDPESFTNSFVDQVINRYFKRVNIQTSSFDNEKWKSTYNVDDLKPDNIQKFLNKILQKDDETKHLKVSKSGEANAKASILKIFSGGGGIKGSYNRNELRKKLREHDITVSFEGNKIIVKSVDVYRINLNKLSNNSSAVYTTTKVRPVGIQVKSGLSIDLARHMQSKAVHYDLAKRVIDLENTVGRLETTNSLLQKNVTLLEKAHFSLKNIMADNLPYKILAVVRVNAHELTYSTPGVAYDRNSGIVTFLNPRKMKFVPMVSTSAKESYITEMHFVQEQTKSFPNQFKVRRTTLDTGNKNSKPYSFTAVVVGIEK